MKENDAIESVVKEFIKNNLAIRIGKKFKEDQKEIIVETILCNSVISSQILDISDISDFYMDANVSWSYDM